MSISQTLDEIIMYCELELKKNYCVIVFDPSIVNRFLRNEAQKEGILVPELFMRFLSLQEEFRSFFKTEVYTVEDML